MKVARHEMFYMHQGNLSLYQSKKFHCIFSLKTSGSSKDWVYEEMNVELSWTWELRDTGDYSAEMPESVIPIQWEETEAGLKALLKFLDEN